MGSHSNDNKKKNKQNANVSKTNIKRSDLLVPKTTTKYVEQPQTNAQDGKILKKSSQKDTDINTSDKTNKKKSEESKKSQKYAQLKSMKPTKTMIY